MLDIETKKEIKAPGRAMTSQYAQIIKNEESIHNLRQVKYSLFFISWQSETFVRIFCHITQYINTYINRKKHNQATQSISHHDNFIPASLPQPTGLFLFLSVRLLYFLHPFLGNNINTHLQNVIPEKSEVENEPDHHIFLHSGLQLR